MDESTERVLRFISHAAKKESADFQYGLGRCYLEVEESTKNYSPRAGWQTDAEDFLKAFYWISRAAEQGHADAQFDLGSLYDFGWRWFVMTDENKAKEWYQKAADQGITAAKNRLAEIHKRSDNEEDRLAAYEEFKAAAEEGDPEAQKSLAEYYSTYMIDMGVEKDDGKAVYWFTKSAKNDDFEASYWLAWHFFEGKGIEQSFEKAKYWAIRADEEYSTDATQELIWKIKAELDDWDDDDEDDDWDDDDEDDFD